MKTKLLFRISVIAFSAALIFFSLAALRVNAQNMNCKAGFTFIVNQSTATFTNTSTGAAKPGYMWNFGDGNNSTLINPVHTYTASGSYNVCLTMVDSISTSCQSTFCDSVVIGKPTTICIASFTYTTNGDTANFTNTSTGGAPPIIYFWDFGDGDTTYQISPTHTYTYNGTYIVCVTMISPMWSCQSKYCDTVVIIGAATSTCVAAFTSYPDTALPSKIHFIDQSGGIPVQWLWSFGDFNLSSQQNPVHQYSMPGTYSVCLTVYTAAGDTCTICKNIVIGSISTGILNIENNFSALTNHPNPFNAYTTIYYSLEESSAVELSIYDMMGRKITELENGNKTAGNYHAEWNPQNLPAGIYWAKLNAEGKVSAKKLVLIK